MSGKPGKPIRKCEICGVRRWKKSTCDVFLARFPLDPDRCQLWVKLTGNEDLAYLPIERLHGNKFICENHFSRDAFNKKGNRLKRNAIPSRNLNAPLSDEILSSFPIVPEYEKSRKETSLHNFPNPNKFLERFKAWVSIVGGELNTSADYEHYKKKKVCDRHFIDEHRTRSKRLSANAIPTILVPGNTL